MMKSVNGHSADWGGSGSGQSGVVVSKGEKVRSWRPGFEIVVYLLIFFLIRATLVEAYKIPSSSMEDSLLIGDFIIADKVTYGGEIPILGVDLPGIRKPEAGDVVVFKWPGDGVTKYIKRCVAVGGDTVEVIDKTLYVNGKLVPDVPGAKYTDTGLAGRQRVVPGTVDGFSRDNFGPYIVPENSYFMMGDNRDNSYDSRYWGAVNDELIVGHAVLVHFSWDDAASPSPAVSLDDPLSVPRLFLYNAVHFFEKVRWSRLLNAI